MVDHSTKIYWRCPGGGGRSVYEEPSCMELSSELSLYVQSIMVSCSHVLVEEPTFAN